MSLLGKQLDFISLCQFRRKFDFRMYPIHVRMQKASIVVTAEKSTLFIQQKRGEEGGTRRRNYLQRILFTQGTKNLDYLYCSQKYILVCKNVVSKTGPRIPHPMASQQNHYRIHEKDCGIFIVLYYHIFASRFPCSLPAPLV